MENVLSLLERIMVEHRAFGNSAYIHQQLRVCYTRRLRKLASRLSSAEHLLDALGHASEHSQYRVLGDTVVRCAIQQALLQLEMDAHTRLSLPDCDAVLRATVRHLQSGKGGAPSQSGAPHVNLLGPDFHHGWIWSEEHSDDVFGRSFRSLIQDNYGAPLCTPNDVELACLRQGVQLLNELLPSLARSALSHSHLVALFPAAGWKGRASSSQFRLGGTIFLNREALQSPWWVAEHLLHESLHQKLYDFRHGHSLLVRDSSQPDPERVDVAKVCSPWNIPDLIKSNYWDTHRAVAAFHVYVHLALLSTVAERRARELETVYGPQRGSLTMTDSRKALDRAHYLGNTIRQLCWQELGLAGTRLIDWLMSALDALDSSPPVPGSYVHLLLDRYTREVKRVEKQIESLGGKTNTNGAECSALSSVICRQQLRELINDEVAVTRSILILMSTLPTLKQFNNAFKHYSESELGYFRQVRGLIAKTLLSVSSDGYRLKVSQNSDTPDEKIRDMVESSSKRLNIILAQWEETTKMAVSVAQVDACNNTFIDTYRSKMA